MNALQSFLAKNPTKGSFYTLSKARFTRQWDTWSSLLPNVHPYYAVKCNPDPTLLQWLSNNGASFDCASTREMRLVQEQFGGQFASQNILFANPCKTIQDIQTGRNLAIQCVTADSSEELLKMADYGYKPNILLRLAVDDSSSACRFGSKFGLLSEQFGEVANVAKRLQFPLLGLSFHIGSGGSSGNAFYDAVRQSTMVWSTLCKTGLVNDKMSILDLGGGWSSDVSVFKKQATSAKKAINELTMPPKAIIAEPGRFFAAPTHDLYVRVVAKKPGLKADSWRYTLDESVYGQFSCIPFDHACPPVARIRLNNNEPQRKQASAILFGRTCDSLDWIANADTMDELEVGDWLYIPNMGAYTTATATEFNGFPKPELFETDERPPETCLSWLSLSYPLAKQLTVG